MARTHVYVRVYTEHGSPWTGSPEHTVTQPAALSIPCWRVDVDKHLWTDR